MPDLEKRLADAVAHALELDVEERDTTDPMVWESTPAAEYPALIAATLAEVPEAKQEALREAADKFQIGDWFNVIQGNAHVKIGNGQRVTDWLRARADKLVTE